MNVLTPFLSSTIASRIFLLHKKRFRHPTNPVGESLHVPLFELTRRTSSPRLCRIKLIVTYSLTNN